jgi:uncharacterized protein YjiS (DUF1127 family)
MTTDVATAISGSLLRRRAIVRKGAATTPRWSAPWPFFRYWTACRRLSRSIAHLNNRLLADAGLTPEDLGLGETLIRGIGITGGTRAIGEADYQD